MLPRHIGVIMDGNRRFAKALARRPWIGHEYGLKKSRQVLEWACESGIRYMTAYTLSLENINTRPKRELAIILRFLEQEADNILRDASHPVHRHSVKVRFIGRTRVLPAALQRKLKLVEKRTAGNSKHTLNIAVAYGGQQEIVDATKEILRKGLKGIITPAQLNETIMKEHLYTNGQPYPDLILRTGGEQRMSNFMPFQAAYAELIFTDKKWPELTRRDFSGALREFARRKRRFGK